MRHQEEKLQEECVRFIRYHYYEHYNKLNHSPNEAKRTEFQGALLKKMGMRTGWPDLELAVPRNGYHGLFVELKTEKGRLSPAQKEVLSELEKEGYLCKVIRSADEFRTLCREYLGKELDPDREVLMKMLNDK